MHHYQEEFQKALTFSQQEGLVKAPFILQGEGLIQEWLMYEVGPKIASYFSKDGFVKFLGKEHNALRLHHLFKPFIDELLHVESIITTGYVSVPNDAGAIEDFGTITEEAVKESLESKNMPLKLHNWITLPSGEVIDLAFMTIYGLIYQEPSLFGNIVARNPKDFTGGMAYYPICLGEAWYETCGFDFSIDFDAFNEDEA